MRLYLIRHAESQNNAKPPFERVCDPSLTAVGRMQAEHLAQWMKSLHLDTLITSPFLRTLQTTRAVLQARPQPVHVWHDVYEQGGCYHGYEGSDITGAAGLGRTHIRRELIIDAIREEAESISRSGDHTNPIAVAMDDEITESGWWGGRPMETESEVRERAARVLRRLESTFADRDVDVGLVIHANFLRCLLRELIGAFVDVDRLGPILNVSVSFLQWQDSYWRLRWLNSVTHLPPRLITGREH